MLALCSTSLLTKHAYLHFAAHTAMVEGKKDFAKIYIIYIYCSEVIGVGIQLAGISSVHGQLHDGLCLVNIGLDCHNDYVAIFHSITTCWPLCLFILNNFKVDMNYKQLMLLVGV